QDLNRELEAHFRCYAEYHRHPLNRLTHKIAIPLIVFHVVAMLDWVPLARVPGTEFTITLAMPVYLASIWWYATLDTRLAAVMAVLFGLCFPLGRLTPKAVVV